MKVSINKTQAKSIAKLLFKEIDILVDVTRDHSGKLLKAKLREFRKLHSLGPEPIAKLRECFSPEAADG